MQSSTPTHTQNAQFVITVTGPAHSTTRPPCACAGRARVYPGQSEREPDMTPEQLLDEVGLRG